MKEFRGGIEEARETVGALLEDVVEAGAMARMRRKRDRVRLARLARERHHLLSAELRFSEEERREKPIVGRFVQGVGGKIAAHRPVLVPVRPLVRRVVQRLEIRVERRLGGVVVEDLERMDTAGHAGILRVKDYAGTPSHHLRHISR